MRWYQTEPPKEGDRRVIEKFLWLPRTIGRETRWLEDAGIEQQLIKRLDWICFSVNVPVYRLEWTDVNWYIPRTAHG